ncbi:hypothetical protein CAPTEDRAFT_105874, partial [Capitella teleta]
MTGIGGDCFALISEPGGQLLGYNGSGRSAISYDYTKACEQGVKEIDADHPLAITVPGAIEAWQALVSRCGTRELGTLFADAISYAEKGFVVAPRVASDWAQLVPRLKKSPTATAHLLKAGGDAPKAGETFAFPALGKTLRAIADKGPDAFYRGELTDDLV